MTPDRWQQIEELFHLALERQQGERAGFLDEACDGDGELRRQVEALLASYEEAGLFIEEAPLAGALSSIADESAGKAAKKAHEESRLIGRRLAHYEIESLLGAGGMGEVYLARDLKLDRRIAIKILPAQLTEDDDQVQRFEREARAASALNHPNIITIHEVGRDEDTHFIATEFVSGQTLREKIANEKMSVEEASAIAIQIADALRAAHAAGIVHRDIKPENIMVRPDGLVKVLDFGLAKSTGHRSSRGPSQGPTAVTLKTDPEMLMGTISYLSPEQVMRREADHRTDIFSLGVVLYEMIAGTRPFRGESASAICDAILQDDAVVDAAIPQSLKQIISRALEKDLSTRYQSADEMRNDLEQFAQESSGIKRGLFSARKGRAAFAIGALVILAAMLALALRREAVTETSQFTVGPVRRITEVPGQEIFPSLSPDGQAIVYASRASGNWDIYLKRIGESQAVNLTADSPSVDLAPAWSPDGTSIAFHSSRQGSGIFLMDKNGRNVTKLLSEGHNPAWSPDGKEIAIAEDRIFDYEGRNAGNSHLLAVNVQTGARRVITESDAVQPNWSPLGHRLAFWGVHKGGRRDIWTVPAIGGEPIAVTDDKAVDWNPVWSRDGKHLYFLSDRGGSMNLWRVPIDELTGRVMGQIEPVTLPSANSQHLSFSADGRALVYVEMNRRENTYQVAFDPATGSITGQPTQITRGSRRYSDIDLSPDEESLVFVSKGEAQEDVFVLNRDSGQLRQLTNDSAQDRLPRWSPDGRQIAFVSDRSGSNELWKVNVDGSGLEQLTDVPGGNAFNPVWSPDGKRLLYKVSNATSFVIETDRPREAQSPQPLSGEPLPGFLPWSWSSDGKLLAGWQLIPELPDMRLAIYSFSAGRYDLLPYRGRNPVWLNDSRRLITVDVSRMFVFDVFTKKWEEIHSVEPYGFGLFAVSRDNRRIYYNLISTEADIWLVNIK